MNPTAEYIARKTCTLCGHRKPLDSFPRASGRKDGRRSRCRPCHAKSVRDWQQTPKQRAARLARARLKAYGVSEDEYLARLDQQSGTCAICREVCSTGKNLAVDHDHSTGAVRGLLCARCNTGIGNLRDRPDLLRQAVEYLEGAASGIS